MGSGASCLSSTSSDDSGKKTKAENSKGAEKRTKAQNKNENDVKGSEKPKQQQEPPAQTKEKVECEKKQTTEAPQEKDKCQKEAEKQSDSSDEELSDENIISASDETNKVERPECVDTLTNIAEEKEVNKDKKLMTEHMYQKTVHLTFNEEPKSVLIFGSQSVKVNLQSVEGSKLEWKITRGRVELLPAEEAEKAMNDGQANVGCHESEYTLGGDDGFLLLIVKGKCVLDVNCVTAQFFSISYYE